MEINNFYKPYITSLFVDEFENINNKYKKENYNWEYFSKIFYDLYNTLSNSNIEEDNFVKYYYLFIFLYLSYTNYLAFLNHKDINNPDLEKIIKKIKTSHDITKNIFKFLSNTNIQQIIKLNNVFILKKIKKIKNDSNNLTQHINTYISDIKQFYKISELDNNTHKKILNLIIYRFIACKNNNYETYHDFYIDKIINFKNNRSLLDFNYFINQIPKSRKILNVVINNSKSNAKISINIMDIINFILGKKNKFYIESTNKNNIVIKNKKIDGSIKIVISDKFDNIEFNQFQTNYNFIHFNLEQLKDFSFLKKSFSALQINIPNNILCDLSSVLEFIHLMTISIKILSSSPSDLYECIYPIDYNNYYFETFCIFFELIKPNINVNYFYNKFVYDVVKFLYIYSYYDYYFYYSNNLINTIINKLEFKNEIFIEFITGLKNVLKLPKELLSYPPFFNNEFDINSIIYYNCEIPNYFKLFDFINAICHIFNQKKYSNNNKTDFVEIMLENIFIDNKNTYINSVSKSISLNGELYNKSDKPDNSNSDSDSNSDSNSDSDSDSDSNSDSDSDSNSNSDSDSNSSNSNDLESSIIISKQLKKNNNIKKTKNDLESNLDSDIINILSKQNIKQMEMPNTYIELNLNQNMSDCIFNTEI